MEWLLFQKICINYCNINNKEASNYTIVFTNTTKLLQVNEGMNKIVDSCGKTEGNTNLKYMMNTPYDINGN